MAKKGQIYKTYSSKFKISVITDMREHHFGYRETVRKYWDVSRGQDLNYVKTVQRWKRIFLEEGAEGLMKDRRGRAYKASGARKGRSPKSEKESKKI